MKAFLITILLALLIDSIIYFLLLSNFQLTKTNKRTYWIATGALLALLFIPAMVVGTPGLSAEKYRFYFFWLAAYLLVYMPKILALHGLLISVGLKALKFKKVKQYFVYVASVLVVGFFFVILHGIFIGKNKVTVYKNDISYTHLPASFDGFKIVQLSDIHLGSFCDTTTMSKSIDKINALNPDVVVMTGDMINILSDEAIPYISLFKRIHARHGIYAILGNHDIRDYRKFDSVKAQFTDIDKLIKIEQDMGFVVLIDSAVIIKQGLDSISILGVNNWGLPPFKQTGKLAKALDAAHATAFKVLLSHDPTHWRAQVLEKTNIALTLSGHTHAMQFGIRSKWFQWSPSKYKYPEYMGLYQQNNQYLYVNVGLGLIGFAGRVGINPEITLITLHSKVH